MAKRPGPDDEMPNPSAVVRDLAPVDVDVDGDDGAAAVSLLDILKLYNQPINEEQAWAVCYQCCRTLAQIQRRKTLRCGGAAAAELPRRIDGPGDVTIWRDGAVKLHFGCSTGTPDTTINSHLHCFFSFFLFSLSCFSHN